jgi:Raf kinase inhibitor-like YbhB/YbcL family protein
MAFSLSSSAFGDGATIPVRFTCDGDDLSPPLAWTEPPHGTAALALVMDDPDAPRGTFTHWLLANIPAEARALDEGAGSSAPGVAGVNDIGRRGYGGPCPPRRDKPHRYRFFLHALRSRLDVAPGADRAAFDRALDGMVIATASFFGRYGRG